MVRSAQIDSKDCPNQTWTRVQSAVPLIVRLFKPGGATATNIGRRRYAARGR